MSINFKTDQAEHSPLRMELPYAVRVYAFNDTGWIDRSGKLQRNRPKRYFATKEEALEFCNGKQNLVLFCPGETWTLAKAKGDGK